MVSLPSGSWIKTCFFEVCKLGTHTLAEHGLLVQQVAEVKPEYLNTWGKRFVQMLGNNDTFKVDIVNSCQHCIT